MRVDYKESLELKNWCFWTVVLEKTLESPLDYKEIKAVNPKGNQSWIFTGRTDAEAETLIHWPPDVKNWLIGRPWCWERLKAGGEGDDRGWDGWMASLTWWTWVWASFGSWWRTGKPGVLQSLGSQRVGHDRLTMSEGWTSADPSLSRRHKTRGKTGSASYQITAFALCLGASEVICESFKSRVSILLVLWDSWN